MKRLLTTIAILLGLTSLASAGDPISLLTGEKAVPAAAEQIPALAQPMPVALPRDENKPVVTIKAQATKADVKNVGPDKIELAALYFYADQKQKDRVDAEFRRLKFKYPDFQLPSDLYQPPAARGIDEKALWALYDKGDIAGVEAEIANRQATISGWQPSRDFAEKFARKKIRAGIELAAKAKNWPGVIAVGMSLDTAREKEIDLVWTLIDAYAASGNQAKLAETYRALLLRDPAHALSKPDLITTIQKATRDFPAADIRAVMARYAADPVVMAGLSGVSLDLVRRTVADFNSDKKQLTPLAKDEIAPLIEAASHGKAASDFSLIGWYELKIGEPAEAGAWFRRALDTEDNIDHAKGLYLSLVKQMRQDEAYQLALEHQKALSADPVFLMNALAERFSKPETGAIDAAAVSAYAATILTTKSADHAEILAWYAYNSGQFQASKAWFSKAFAWEPEEPRLKGLALSEAQLGDRDGLAALYKRYAAAYPAIWNDIHLGKPGKNAGRTHRNKEDFIDRIKVGAVRADVAPEPANVEIESEIRPERRRQTVSVGMGYIAALQAKNYGKCLAGLMAEEARAALSPDASAIKGWCLMGLDRTAEARTAFSAALAGGGKTRADAAYGLALTLLRGKMTDEAESVLALYPLGEVRDHELRAEIYWQKARSSFDLKQYQRTLDALNARMAVAPEPANLTQMRAWAHFNLGHVGEAREIFRRLSEYLDDPGVRRGLAATSGLGGKIK